MFFKKFELISNRTTIEFNQFDNIRFIVFGKFCFEETKRSHTKTKNEKKLIKSLKKIFFDIEILRNVFFVFVFQTKLKWNEVFFRGAIKNELFHHKKNETLTSLWHSTEQQGSVRFNLTTDEPATCLFVSYLALLLIYGERPANRNRKQRNKNEANKR